MTTGNLIVNGFMVSYIPIMVITMIFAKDAYYVLGYYSALLGLVFMFLWIVMAFTFVCKQLQLHKLFKSTEK